MVPGGSRRRPFLAPLGVALVLVLLGVGIWLGGHPNWLPGPVRDTLVWDGDTQLYDEAAGIIEHDYYRKVSRTQLVNKAIGSAGPPPEERFSQYLSPPSHNSFAEAPAG